MRSQRGVACRKCTGRIRQPQRGTAFPRRAASLPAESTFFLAYADQITTRSPEINQGVVRLDDSLGLAPLVDWRRVERYRI
jgi:hypothetical protein